MARKDDERITRTAAREARRAALRARQEGDNDGGEPALDPLKAARDAATAAAVGAAVGAARALAARREEEEPEAEFEDDEPFDDAEPEAVQDEEREPQAESRRSPPPPREGAEPTDVAQMVRTAREHLQQLQGAQAESVSSFERTRDGYAVTLEVVEMRRVPETTDLLGSYRVELDGDRNLISYERVRRYRRSEALDGSSP